MALRSPDPWDLSPLPDDDEIDPETGRVRFVARWRAAVLENRETDRIVFCSHHGIDPSDTRVCHGCRGTGVHWQNGYPCWCEQGKKRLRELERREQEQTAELARLIAQGRTEL